MVTKELFADFVKEKKLREPEEKEELAQTLKTYYVEARKKEFIQCIQIYNNYCFIQLCDIQDNQGLSNGYNPYLDLDNLFWISQKPHSILFIIYTTTRKCMNLFCTLIQQ